MCVRVCARTRARAGAVVEGHQVYNMNTSFRDVFPSMKILNNKLLSTLHSFLFSPLSQMLHFGSFYAIFLLCGLLLFYGCSCLYCPGLSYHTQASMLSPGQVSACADSEHRPLCRPAPSGTSFAQPLTSRQKLHSAAVLCFGAQSRPAL